ncbi:Oligodendrocyte-myelin glycoprotein [Lonchura striata]|uniref:Oligodendrocyte-myelin glycoprotein n=2 Tax=Lonchura striata TaxID=40157 RepID=A0A218ULR1_9PASE|nr:Oligodendrocyte-myelin glycoprotein [Lonchura striata domestica]
MVERAVLINNTLSSLKFLNLSSNKLWTVPTNMPYNIETVDLSNNFLSQILPGTLVRLQHLTSLYLHNNKFSYIPDKAFDQLSQLQEITLYNNPWSCSDNQNIPYVLQWVQGTAARVVGAPCADLPWPWASAAPPAQPTALDSSPIIKGTKAAGREASAAAPEPTKVTKTHKQFKAKEASPLATQSPPALFPGTDRPLPRAPDGPQEAAATRTILVQDSTAGNASLAPATGPSTTPMTLSITSGMPTNYSKMPQSTTTTFRKEEATPSARVPSRASRWQTGLLCLALLHAAAVAMD